jgi:hypothetical protein
MMYLVTELFLIFPASLDSRKDEKHVLAGRGPPAAAAAAAASTSEQTYAC